jgi:hypothetical protein
MYFQTVAAISLTVEFVVISAIVLTLLNAMLDGRLFAQFGRARDRVLGKAAPAPSPIPDKAISRHEAAPLRRAA